jgi:non-ribosomal peptide synthetase component F
VLVPLCFEKSMWTTVVIVSVLKARGGFVLLDSSLPEQRLKAIVEQVRASLLLSSLFTQALSSRLGQEVVTVSSGFFADIGDEAIQHLPRHVLSSVLYVVFTSGSTGSPKGVVITHRNIASALHYQVEPLGLTRASRVFDFSSYNFDASIFNVLMTLATGGCLCVSSDEDQRNNIPGSIVSLRANVVLLTPSVAQFLSPEQMPELKSIIFGSEAVHVRDVKP